MFILDSNDKAHEECGVFGIYDTKGQNVAGKIYYGLNALQHRGQESCGIAVCDTAGPKGNVNSYKGMGLVRDVFTKEHLSELQGNLGIGHVRYSTTGESTINNAQPIVLKYFKGTLAFAHNGNIVNAASLRRELEEHGTLFQTGIDSEVIACMIAKARIKEPTIEAAVMKVAGRLEGGYALLIASPRKLVGVRDHLGLKPLCIGKTPDGHMLASETCALDSIGAEFIRDVEPGEIVTITADGITSNRSLVSKRNAHCIFEYIYFARTDSKIDGVSVYESRIKAGRLLAKAFPADADIVAGVPDSGLTAAMGYAQESGIPFSLIFHKNTYVGRTFIQPTQKERQNAVKMKLSVLKEAVKGKRIVLIDDSIVRGTTITGLIKMLKEAGAVSVHVRISAPPFLYPCYYGTDVPTNNQLLAGQLSIEDIRKSINADSLEYMRIGDLDEMAEGLSLCKACFNNDYPHEWK